MFEVGDLWGTFLDGSFVDGGRSGDAAVERTVGIDTAADIFPLPVHGGLVAAIMLHG